MNLRIDDNRLAEIERRTFCGPDTGLIFDLLHDRREMAARIAELEAEVAAMKHHKRCDATTSEGLDNGALRP